MLEIEFEILYPHYRWERCIILLNWRGKTWLGTMYPASLPKELMKALKGTTTVGIAFKDFVVLGADRRATSGFYIAHKRAQKIHKVDEHIAVTIAGYVGDAQWLVERLKTEAVYYKLDTGEPIGVRALATLASTFLFRNRPLIVVQMLIGGVDGEGAGLYSLDWLGTVTKERFTATGSGTPFAISIIESEYREDATPKDGLRLAAKAVRAAALRDPGSGEGVDLALVGREGVRFYKGEDLLA